MFALSALLNAIAAYFPMSAAGKMNPLAQLKIFLSAQAVPGVIFMLIEIVSMNGRVNWSLPLLWPTVGLLWSGIGATFLAYLAYYFVFKNWGPVRTSSMNLLLPLVANLADLFFERATLSLPIQGKVGIVLILGGHAGTFWKKKHPPPVQ
jgi:drug/metabolite transporter (DMT)-like permease